MGDIADGLVNGDFDHISGEYLGEGFGVPRTFHNYKRRKSEDLSWKKVVMFLRYDMGIKPHLHPVVLKNYGCTYSGRHPLRNACFEVLKDFEKFKRKIQSQSDIWVDYDR